MHSFKDTNGKDHALTLTVGAFRRVKEQIGISLDELIDGDPPLVMKLDTDSALLGQVLHAITNVDLDAIGGKSLGEARTAFWEAMIDFFREAGRMEMVKVIEIPKEARAKLLAKLNEKSE